MKKTALQSAIDEIQAMPNYSTGIEYRLRNKIIEILESKLPEEKQDLIDAYQCGADEYFDADMYHKTGTDYFKEEFEI